MLQLRPFKTLAALITAGWMRITTFHSPNTMTRNA